MVTLVRRMTRRPLMKLSVGWVVSISGAVVWGGSGVAWGQSGSVRGAVWAWAEGRIAGVRRRVQVIRPIARAGHFMPTILIPVLQPVRIGGSCADGGGLRAGRRREICHEHGQRLKQIPRGNDRKKSEGEKQKHGCKEFGWNVVAGRQSRVRNSAALMGATGGGRVLVGWARKCGGLVHWRDTGRVL